MKVLIVNPILYTSETKQIKRAKSIKDTMIYDLCLGFQALGAEPVLYAAEPYKPTEKEDYPFEVIFAPCRVKGVFLPHRLPYMPSIKKYIAKHGAEFDLIISSEVFSMQSLMLAAPRSALIGRHTRDKLVIWHELAQHNAMLRQIPSKLWYNVIARLFFMNTTVVARSEAARQFISKYCASVSSTVIDHGVNLNKFKYNKEKSNQFCVCSQLIERKRIDLIIEKFKAYLDKFSADDKLYIIGDGELRAELEAQAKALGLEGSVIFTGKLAHSEMLPILAGSKAMLVNTRQDNNMLSIIESIAVGTPVITTTVPLNCPYIIANRLGIADDNWDENSLDEISKNNEEYINNCLEYRKELSTERCAKQFMDLV